MPAAEEHLQLAYADSVNFPCPELTPLEGGKLLLTELEAARARGCEEGSILTVPSDQDAEAIALALSCNPAVSSALPATHSQCSPWRLLSCCAADQNHVRQADCGNS
jgi:hypothetical protein